MSRTLPALPGQGTSDRSLARHLGVVVLLKILGLLLLWWFFFR
ncbi:MAG TPA: hypothetical protein VII31_11000 [Caldimonas sp.]|jgi:hypothetical protein